MAVRSLPIDEASPIQVRAFATNFLNLDIPDTADDAAVLAAVRQASPNIATIFELVDENDAEEPAQQNGAAAAIPLAPEEFAGRMQGTLGQGDPRAVIQIPVIETEDSSGSARCVRRRQRPCLAAPKRGVQSRCAVARHPRAQERDHHDSSPRRPGRTRFGAKLHRFPFHFISAEPSEGSDCRVASAD
jgi:hypothetical protein